MDLFSNLLDKFLGDPGDEMKDQANQACIEGQSLFSMGRMDEALTCFDRALQHNPQHLVALSNKATCHHMLEQYEPALECHQAIFATGVVPDPRIYFLMAVEQLNLNLKTEARVSLESFLAQDLPEEDVSLEAEAQQMLIDLK